MLLTRLSVPLQPPWSSTNNIVECEIFVLEILIVYDAFCLKINLMPTSLKREILFYHLKTGNELNLLLSPGKNSTYQCR